MPTPLPVRDPLDTESEGLRHLVKIAHLGRLLAEASKTDPKAIVLPPQQLPRAGRTISPSLQGTRGSDVL